MSGLAEAIETVVARFRGVQVDGQPLRAFSEPTDVNPPCVFVPPPDVTFQFHKHRLAVTWTAYVVAPTGPRQPGAFGHLAAIVDAVAGLFPFTAGDLYTLTLPGGGPPAQAYRLTWNATIAIGDDSGD